jgi:hypothetical protein
MVDRTVVQTDRAGIPDRSPGIADEFRVEASSELGRRVYRLAAAHAAGTGDLPFNQKKFIRSMKTTKKETWR